MVKKLKAMADSKADNNQLSAAIKDSAQQIWLAGLGAFSKAQEEGSKVFEALVKEGSSIQMRSKAFTEEKFGEVTGKVTKVAGDVAKQATQSWDKLESVFEERVARALSRLGVPTSKDVAELIARIEALNESVQSLGGKPAAAARKPRTPRAVRAVKAKVEAVVAKPVRSGRKAAKRVAKAVAAE